MGWKKDLRASWKLHPVNGRRRGQRDASNIPLGIDLQRWRRSVALFSTVHDSSHVLWCSRLVGRAEWVKQMGGKDLERDKVACELS